jgi:aminopeptidase N
MIPFSEDSGFVARARQGEIDPAFLITAHEVAHQWWAHQAVGADVAGAAMLTESLAHYTAGAVVARTYGEQALRTALRYELDRYLTGRAHETIAERPLAECERQPYVHYSKGALALHALAHRIGRDALDAALADYLHAYRYKGPPYPTSRDLLARIVARTPAADRWLVGVLFDTVTLYDLRVAGVRRRGDAGEVAVVLRQLRAEADGRDREVAPRAWVAVAVVDRRGTELWRGSRLMEQPRATIRVPILPRAARVVADPDLTLIERERDDNAAPLDGG